MSKAIVTLCERFLTDLRYARRTLTRKSPSTAFVMLALIATGICFTTVAYSILYGTLLRPLPFPFPQQLVRVSTHNAKEPASRLGVSLADLDDLQRGVTMVQAMAAWRVRRVNLLSRDAATPVNATFATADLFATLGVTPLLGTGFSRQDTRPGGDAKKVVIGYALWKSRFGQSRAAIGRTIKLDTGTYTIVGVAPQGFRFPRNSAIWLPLPNVPFRADRRTSAVARLRDDITLDVAQQDFERVGRRLQHDYPKTNRDVLPVLEPFRKAQVAAIQPYVVLLGAAATLVLLVCGSNLSNLLLIRAHLRARELALRAALGAVRSRLVIQLLMESTMLAFAGGLAGIASAWALLQAVPRFIPMDLPYWMVFSLDSRVLAISCALTLGTALVFGTVPALHASRVNLRTALEEGGRASASSGYRRFMVASQVSLTFVLVVSAGLMIESLSHLRETNPGFHAENVMTFKASPYRQGRFRQANAARIEYFRKLSSRLEQLPRVLAVGVTSSLPYELDQIARGRASYNFEVKGDASNVIAHRVPAAVVDVMPNYFAAMRIPVLEGRAFTDRDTMKSQRVVVLSKRAAAVLFPNGNAIGRSVRQNTSGNADPWATVIGVVGNVRYNPEDADTAIEMYAPLAQWQAANEHVVVHFDQLRRGAAALIRRAAAEVDPGTGADDIEPMARVVRDAVWRQRLWGLGLGALAAIGCVLSAIALYALIAYDVAARRRDFGIRAALGASPFGLFRQVIGEGLTVVGIGIGFGAFIAFIAAKIMSNLLYGVSPADPAIFALSAILLLIVSLVAASIPGLRAGRSTPAWLLADTTPPY